MRSALRALLVAVVIVAAGCGSSPTASEGRADLTVEALDIDFDRDAYVVASGEVAIEYLQRGSIRHTLLIEDANGNDLDLRLSVGGGTGRRDTALVDLAPGAYVIYCDIAGHRAAGMEATLTVNPPAPTQPTSEEPTP